VCGGSWVNDPWTLRASFRSRDGPGTRNDTLGFVSPTTCNPLPFLLLPLARPGTAAPAARRAVVLRRCLIAHPNPLPSGGGRLRDVMYLGRLPVIQHGRINVTYRPFVALVDV
jgi:hypothetical protein